MNKKEYPPLTHDYLNQLTAKWVVNNMNAHLVFIEHKHGASKEIPDVLMFRNLGDTSVCFEIKATRSDFLSDKNKPHRINPELGVGDYRFYVAPVGVIKKSDLPPKWGLLEVTPAGRFKKTYVPRSLQSLYSGASEWSVKHIKEMFQHLSNKDRPPYYSDISPTRLIRNNLQDDFRFLFKEKNDQEEKRLLFAAMRQQVVAQNQGVPVTIDTIFQRPFAAYNEQRESIKHKR